MKILLWSQNDPSSLGGVEVFLRILAKGLVDRGHEVQLVAGHTDSTQSPNAVIDGLRIDRFRFFEALSTRSIEEMDRVIAGVKALKQTFAPDVIHISLTDAGPFFHLRSDAERVPMVLSLHDALGATPSVWPLALALAERARAIVAPSIFLAEDVRTSLSLSEERVRVIERGIGKSSTHATVGPRFGAPFVTLSRLVPEKGLRFAIDAVADLRTKGVYSKLRIVGAGPDAVPLMRYVEDRGVVEQVEFVGRVAHDAISSILDGALAVLVPSIFPETFGISAADGALAGLPVIASRIGALPEVVLHEETGMLVPPGDGAALGDMMERLIRDHALACRLGKAARERAAVLYDRGRMIDRFEVLYRSAIAGPQQRSSGTTTSAAAGGA